MVDGKELRPGQSLFKTSGQVVLTPDTHSSFTEDIQTSLRTVPREDGDPIVIQITRQPLITWLWVGGLMMLAGTVLSAFPGKRHRRPTQPTSVPTNPEPVGAS